MFELCFFVISNPSIHKSHVINVFCIPLDTKLYTNRGIIIPSSNPPKKKKMPCVKSPNDYTFPLYMDEFRRKLVDTISLLQLLPHS